MNKAERQREKFESSLLAGKQTTSHVFKLGIWGIPQKVTNYSVPHTAGQGSAEQLNYFHGHKTDEG